MYKLAKPFFMIVQTPLHAGSGQDLGIVDLPIQRERHTSFPKIEGSSLKGAIREVFEEYNIKYDNHYKLIDIAEKEDNKDTPKAPINKLKKEFPTISHEWKVKKKNQNGQEEEVTNTDKEGRKLNKFNEAISLAFGPENGDDHAGALGFTDARLLLFPVKSMKGIFAYITCPYVLERFKDDLELCFDEVAQDITCKIIENGKCSISSDQLKINNNIILEEYTFEIANANDNGNGTKKLLTPLTTLTGIHEIENKLVILSNDDFKDFVNLSTEVITRNRIDPVTGTVKDGHLFTEEYLPAESVLYSLALTTPIFITNEEKKGIFKKNETGSEEWQKKEESRVMEFFKLGLPEVIQIGGNATIGKGIVRTHVYNGGQTHG